MGFFDFSTEPTDNQKKAIKSGAEYMLTLRGEFSKYAFEIWTRAHLLSSGFTLDEANYAIKELLA